jgi:Domain of unknown function (DUF4136)
MTHEPTYRSEKMVKVLLLSAVLATASLAGCAGLSADVHTDVPANSAVALPGESTYTITRIPSQEASADPQSFEALVRDELARHGFAYAPDKRAHYLLSIAYATRPANVSVSTPGCAPGDCDHQAETPFALFGSQVYQHSLTLRFFDHASGEERYKVSAITNDRNADPLQAMPTLVKSALAKLPFEAPSDWRVTLRADKTSGAPEVTSVKPLQP